ncbi:MAG TPA: hypothetical protein VN633_14455 [Bryobacteraceae bacterium]|nr:hypothetical protein [Bryobacteraceae bacterium]
MANAVADIQIHAALVDDYLYIQDQPVVPAPGRFVAVQDTAGQAPVTHLLTLDSNGNLLHFRPEPTSHSGWNVTQVPHRSTSGSITAISAVFYNGALDVLLSFSDDLSLQLCSWAGGDSWFYADLDNTLQGFMGMPNFYFYGPNQAGLFIDPQGIRYLYLVPNSNINTPLSAQLGCYDGSAKIWRAVAGSDGLPGYTPGFRYWLEGSTADGIGLLSCSNSSEITFTYGTMTDGGGSNPSFSEYTYYSVDYVIDSDTAPQVISVPGQAGVNSLLLLDSEGNLFQTVGQNPEVQKLTGGANAPAGATYVAAQLYGSPSGKKTDSSNLAIFLIEQGTQRLWICRQNGTQGPGAPTFGPWVPLGNQLEAIVCAEYVAGNPEVFTVDLDMNIYRIAQDANDTIWTTRKVAGPTPPQGTPSNIASTLMNIQAVDSRGTPVGSALLTVSVTTPTTLIANQLSYLAEPSAPAVIPLDATGSAAVYYQATTLASNRLTFSVTNSDGSSAERWCEGDMVELKTNETPPPARTDSVAQKLASASQDDLQNSGLLDPSYSDPNAAVQSINSLGNWMITQSSQAGSISSKIKTEAWRLDLNRESGPVFHTLTTEEAESHLVANAALLGGFFGHVWGDIVHGVKHFWDKVTSVVAKVTADGIEFAINLGDQVAHFVVNTARQAAAAAEMIFAVIKKAALAVYDAIQDVIAWLKLLFEWQDILYTHQALRSCFNQFLSMIAGSIGTFQNLLSKQFSDFSSQISQAFDNAANSDIFQNSFNQYVQSIQSQTKKPSGLDGGMYNSPYQQHSTRIHYVYHHAKSHYASNSSLNVPRLGDISNLTASIQNNWNADNGFQQRAQAVHNQITGNGISKFFDLVIKDFLLAVKDIVLFILQGAEDILTTMLGLVEDAVKGLQSALNASIDIPVISYIYKLISGDDLSILDLLCLILAVPVTILYKVIFGSAPFSADSVNQLNNLPWPWLSGGAGASDAKSLAALSRTAPKPVYATLGVVAGICDYFGAFFSSACDALAFADTSGYNPLMLFLSWSSVTIAGLTQVCGAPWSVFPESSWSTADKWDVALWAVSIAPFAADTIFTVATGALAEFTAELGPILDTGLGLGMTGLGAATCMFMAKSNGEYNGWDCANSIIPWPARFFKWCILGKDDAEAAPVLAAVLIGADALFGIGSTVTQIGSAVAG